MDLSCPFCGREFDYDAINVNIYGVGVTGGIVCVCQDCTGHTLAELIEAAERGKKADQFSTQATLETAELTRDPGECKEWIKDKSRIWDESAGHYCTRNAVAWGYCKQHLWTHGIDAKTGKKKDPGYPVASGGAA